MDFSIDSNNIKSFSKVLQCLSKFSDHINLYANSEQGLSIMSMSNDRTAYGEISLGKQFFTKFHIHKQSKTISEVQLSAKQIISILKRRAMTTNVRECAMSISEEYTDDDNGYSAVCRFKINVNCENGIVKTHSLMYSRADCSKPVFDKSQNPNYWSANSRTLRDWTEHFITSNNRIGTGAITMLCRSKDISFRSFDEVNIELESVSKSYTPKLNTSLTADTQDFESYYVNWSEFGNQAQALTFSLKEFKAVIALGDSLAFPLQASFNSGGNPLILDIYGGEIFSCVFVLATNANDPLDSTFANGQQVRLRHKSTVPPPVPALGPDPGLNRSQTVQSNVTSKRSSSTITQVTQMETIRNPKLEDDAPASTSTTQTSLNTKTENFPDKDIGHNVKTESNSPLFVPPSQDEYDAHLANDMSFEEQLLVSSQQFDSQQNAANTNIENGNNDNNDDDEPLENPSKRQKTNWNLFD